MGALPNGLEGIGPKLSQQALGSFHDSISNSVAPASSLAGHRLATVAIAWENPRLAEYPDSGRHWSARAQRMVARTLSVVLRCWRRRQPRRVTRTSPWSSRVRLLIRKAYVERFASSSLTDPGSVTKLGTRMKLVLGRATRTGPHIGYTARPSVT